MDRDKYLAAVSTYDTAPINKSSIKLDITILDLMTAYVLSENKSIKRSNLINMGKLLDIIDTKGYNGEQLGRLDFIRRGIDARLKYNLNRSDMIINHIYGGLSCPPSTSFNELNNNEIMWINKMISETLKYFTIYDYVDSGIELLTKFKSTDYTNRGPIVQQIEEWTSALQNEFRRVKVDTDKDNKFSLLGEEYVEGIRETHKQLSSPSNRLQFGVQGLNILTGGGVESTRIYTLLGLSGEGKSATLIDMAIQLKRYNPHYRCKDPTKRPCIVLLTMENSIKETIQRIFSMCVGDDMLKYSEDEALEVLKTKGNLAVTDTDPINIVVIYKPNLSIDTSYLYSMTEDLEDEGFEVICVLLDYLRRIKSVVPSFNSDVRLQLGAVTNECKTFATNKEIPLITAAQLNRAATSTIDEARINNKADLVRLIGRSNVSESNLIIDNSDWVGLITPEFDKNGMKYLGIQLAKYRTYIKDNIHFLYLPYIGNSIKLVEDFYTHPVHRTTMKELPELNGAINSMGIVNEIKEFTECDDIIMQKGDNNIFLNSSMAMRSLRPTMICDDLRYYD